MRITMRKGCVQHFGLQHQVLVFPFLGHILPVFLWSYCVYVFVNLLWTWLSLLSTYLRMSLQCQWWGNNMIQVGDVQMQAVLSSFQAFSVEWFCCHILAVHLIWIKTPDSCLKFCINTVIYKNSFSIECIYAHIDVYICRQNPYVNNTKYWFLKFHININTCRYKLWAIFNFFLDKISPAATCFPYGA